MKNKEIEIKCKVISDIHHQKVFTIDKLSDKKVGNYLVSLANQSFGTTPMSELDTDFELTNMAPSEVCVWVRERTSWKNIYILLFDY